MLLNAILDNHFENYENDYKNSFCSSVNGKKLALVLNSKYNLGLLNKIRRHDFRSETIKFLMISKDNEVYFFHGTVLDFLMPDIEFDLVKDNFYFNIP